MNVLMGKVARTSGRLFINEEEGEMQKFRKIIGFVPQEDTMNRELTVRENIYHSARVRLPKSWKLADVNKYVDALLEVLNLTHVQNNKIGTESERGISGGQRKRVNIGIELAGVPLAIFLDEPTSGLDSTAALKVSEIPPSNSIPWAGRTAYMGPTSKVVKYFTELGFYFDTQANPADILMDILNGKGINVKCQNLDSDGLVSRWENFGKQWLKGKDYLLAAANSNASLSRMTPGGGRALDAKGSVQSIMHSAAEQEEALSVLGYIAKRRGSNFFLQAILCHNRFLIQQYRRPSSLALEIGVSTMAGGLIGLSIAIQKGVLYKGIIVYPYIQLTPSTAEWLALHFTAIFAFLALPSTPFPLLYLNFLLVFFCVHGLAMFISMIVRKEDSPLLAVVISLSAAVFCGYGPSIKDGKKMGIQFIFDISYNRWSTEAWLSQELALFDGIYMIERTASHFGYVLNNEKMNFLYMFGIGIGWRVLAFVFMVVLHRDKQM
ncbi:hypothetical protein BDR26DRAFT_857366, partial [Obelidium mucronatum]